ncbi:MAG TPA: glycosyltransferase [Nitrospirae bacterium]|nr:glycosyltransferase [Nitrospirota bacterium]
MEKRIKVLHIHGSAGIGGTEKIAFEFLKKIDKERFETCVLFDCPEGDIQHYYEKEKISFMNSLGLLKNIRFILGFAPDIVHLYGLRVNLKWRLLLRLLGLRNVVGTLEGLTNTGRVGFWRIKSDVWTSCFLRKYIAVSGKIAGYLKDKGLSEDKIELIYNGVEAGKFNKPLLLEKKVDLKKHLGVPLDSIVISCVANLRPVKGHIFLIKALSILKEMNFSVLIIGEGDLKDRLVERSAEKGLDDKVFFLGGRTDIPELLAITDIFVLPSLSEGMPVSVMEAMASGVPVVATDVGGVSELVIDGETGFLVPSQTPELLAEKISILMDDEELRKTMGRKGLERIKSQFAFETMVRKTEDLYRRLFSN